MEDALGESSTSSLNTAANVGEEEPVVEPGVVSGDHEDIQKFSVPNLLEAVTRINHDLSYPAENIDTENSSHKGEAPNDTDVSNHENNAESVDERKEDHQSIEMAESHTIVLERRRDNSGGNTPQDDDTSQRISERTISPPPLTANDSEDAGTIVKCAGCGKIFKKMLAVPQKANRILLSLCDDCENITSAMFLCLNCGQECTSLAALRAHKQTHLLPDQRIFVCEICGVGFTAPDELESHTCVSAPVDKSKPDAADGKPANLGSPLPQKPSRRKSKAQKVEAIVSSLSKRTQAKTRNSKTSQRASATQRSQASKQVQPSTRPTRARSTRKAVLKIATASPAPRQPKLAAIRIVKPPISRAPIRKKLKPPEVFQCTDCFEFFTDKKEFRKHKYTHKEKESYPCPVCQRMFKNKGSLKRHVDAHSRDQSDVCEICEKKFQSPQNMLTHKKTVHSDEKPFVCDICKKAFKQLGNMKTHRRTHTGEKPFICKECGRSFAQMGNLQAHMVIHASSKPHVCEICGKSFSYLRSLQNHMRGTHTGERPFVCGICEKTFSNQSVLRDHRRTHSDKRGYLCDKCGKGFKSYKNLKQHEKFHLEVRPYSCQDCGKSFVWYKSFQLHKRTHTGEKPYSCEHCDKCFSNINSMKNHRKKHMMGPMLPPAPKRRSHAKAAPQSAEISPTPSPTALPTIPPHPGHSQSMLIPHPSLHQGPPRDHMLNSMHPHAQGQSTSPSTTPPLHPSLPPHSQAYGHVVFPHAFPPFVTNTGGDFTIL